MSRGRTIALFSCLIATLATRPAAACKLDAFHPFPVNGQLHVGRAIPFGVSAHVEHAGMPPVGFPFGCSAGATLVVSVTGVPPGEWGMLVSGAGAGSLGVPGVPFVLDTRSAFPTEVVLDDMTNPYLVLPYHARLTMQLVAPDGAMTPPVYAVVDGPLKVRWGSCLLQLGGVILAFLLYRGIRRAKSPPPPPPLPRATSFTE